MRQLAAWLGAGRVAVLVVALVGAVAGSVIAQFAVEDADTRLSVQLGLVGSFVAVLGVALSGRVSGQARQRLWIALGPGLALLALGVVFPPLALFFGGAGLGWMIMGQFVLRGRVRMEYQSAVKHMRAGDYNAAIDVMSDLVRAEPNAAEHYRFRAELFRLANKPRQAARDYRRVIELEPDAITGYTGLAEIAAQQGDYEQAHDYALQATRRDPYGWMPVYNLGMIADRRVDPEAAVEYLERALTRRIEHSRYRLMARVWLARNYYRMGRNVEATRAVEQMRKENNGLREWEMVMQSDDSGPLRDLLADDVALARQLVESRAPLEVLDARQD